MRSTRLLLLLVMMALSPFASAHQQKEAYTTVLFNSRSGNLEVSHRFYLHDAEHALRLLGGPADLVGDIQSRERFAEYVIQHFRLKDANDQLLSLKTVGYEVEGKYFWVYQEIPIPKATQSLKVKMPVLQEVWPRQINHINIERDRLIRSVRLGKEDDWEVLTF